MHFLPKLQSSLRGGTGTGPAAVAWNGMRIKQVE
jgi:hypothetical protein